MSNLLATAKAFVKTGISVIATDQNKIAVQQWKKFQSTLPANNELESMFSHRKAVGIAIICGTISGNLELVDVDSKYDLEGTLFENLMGAIHEASPDLSDKLMVVQTRNGGYHLYYRCTVIEGNQKLAQRPATEDEIKENPNEKVLVLIETRGEAGYAVTVPTEGYKLLHGKKINSISPEQRTTLLEICRTFNKFFKEYRKPTEARVDHTVFDVSPWDDYNKRGIEHMVDTLINHGWKLVNRNEKKVTFKRPGKSDSKSSGDYSYDHNLFMVFTTSSEFEPLRGYRPATVYAILEHKGDFSKAAKELIKKGYGQKHVDYGDVSKNVFKLKHAGASTEDLIKTTANDLKVDEEKAKEIVDKLTDRWEERLLTFWYVADNDKVYLVRTKLEQFLSVQGGFYLYFFGENNSTYKLVKVQDGLIQEATIEQVKKFIKNYLLSLKSPVDTASREGGIHTQELLELVYKGGDRFFTNLVDFIDHISPDFLRDGPEAAYFPFNNGVVTVNKKDIVIRTYGDVQKIIWQTEIIPFDVSIDQQFEVDDCEYYIFLKKICGGDEDRLFHAMSLIGYLLHKYKDPGRPWAVILAEETELESEGGGTGKGLFVKALSYLLKTVIEDGKTFKTDKNFALQKINLDTKLFAIEDVRKNVDFESFYSLITEGMTVEKKNRDAFFIPYRDSPKVVFTTNYTFHSQGTHAKRRQRVFEFAPFFKLNYTPIDLFGHKLFDDWDNDEWNRFYNLMFACVNTYLIGGVKETEGGLKMKRKHIRLNYTEEFLSYWDHYQDEKTGDDWVAFKELYAEFVLENGFDKRDYSQKRFKKAMEVAADAYSNVMQSGRNRAKAGVVEVRMQINSEGVSRPTPLKSEKTELAF